MVKKIYKYKAKDYKDKVRKYFDALDEIESRFHKEVFELEKKMEKELKIKGIEFFRSDDGYCGIGNVYRTMELIHRH